GRQFESGIAKDLGAVLVAWPFERGHGGEFVVFIMKAQPMSPRQPLAQAGLADLPALAHEFGKGAQLLRTSLARSQNSIKARVFSDHCSGFRSCESDH